MTRAYDGRYIINIECRRRYTMTTDDDDCRDLRILYCCDKNRVLKNNIIFVVVCAMRHIRDESYNKKVEQSYIVETKRKNKKKMHTKY